MLKVVFMGTPEFAVPALEAVHRVAKVVGVYTQPDRPTGRGLDVSASPVKRRALEFGLPIFQPEKLSQPGEFERLKELAPDLIVVVAYGQILKKSVLELPRLGCVNIHSSLLPRWRGAAPIQWAILSGDRETGVSTMRLVEKLDAGHILLQHRVPIRPWDTAKTIHDQLAAAGAKIIVPTLQALEDGTIQETAQDEKLVTYASKLTKEMEWIDPRKSAQELDLCVRALNPWPGTSLRLKSGDRLKVKKATPRADLDGELGQITLRNGMLILGTSQGALELETLQWEGKKECSASEFLNGLQGRGKVLPLGVEFPA